MGALRLLGAVALWLLVVCAASSTSSCTTNSTGTIETTQTHSPSSASLANITSTGENNKTSSKSSGTYNGASKTQTGLSTFTGTGTTQLTQSAPTLFTTPYITVYSNSGLLTTVTLWPWPGAASSTISVVDASGTFMTVTSWPTITWVTSEPPPTTSPLGTFTGTTAPPDGIQTTTAFTSPFVSVFPTDGTSTTLTFWPAPSAPASLSPVRPNSTTSGKSITPAPSSRKSTTVLTTSFPISSDRSPVNSSTTSASSTSHGTSSSESSMMSTTRFINHTSSTTRKSSRSFVFPNVTSSASLTNQLTSAAPNLTSSSMPPINSSVLSTYTGSSWASPTFLSMTNGTPSVYITVYETDGHRTTQTVWPLWSEVPPSVWTSTGDHWTATVTSSLAFPWATGSIEGDDEDQDKWTQFLVLLLRDLQDCTAHNDITACEGQRDDILHFIDWLKGQVHGEDEDGDCRHPKCHSSLTDPLGAIKCGIEHLASIACDILQNDINGIKIDFPGLNEFSIIFPKITFPLSFGEPGPEPPGPKPTPTPTSNASKTSTQAKSCTETLTATNTVVTCSVGLAGSGSNSTTTVCSSNTHITRGCSVRLTATTTTITSCSRKTTVTDAIVSCSQTTIGASRTDASVVCSTSATLVSGCDVTATTKTTTASSCPTGPMKASTPGGSPECIVPMCSAELCGGACDWTPAHNVTSNASLALARDLANMFVLPVPNSDSPAAFNLYMVEQYQKSNKVPQPRPFYPFSDPTDPRRWETSSIFMPFEDHPDSIAIGGLFGCTSVVVVSREGAWMSHIWEYPTFGTTQPEDFSDPASQLLYGNTKDDVITPLVAYMKDRGTFDPNGDVNIKVWIVTPINMNFVGVARPTLEQVKWPAKIDTIRGLLQDGLKVRPNIMTYIPLSRENRFYDVAGSLNLPALRKELDTTARGKVILQYDNKQIDCKKRDDGIEQKQQAIWRLWVDQQNNRQPVDQDMWIADEDQVGEQPAEQQAAFLKAIEEQCQATCPAWQSMLYYSDGTEKRCHPPPCSRETCGTCGDPPATGISTNFTGIPPGLLNITGVPSDTNELVLPLPSRNDLAAINSFMVAQAGQAEGSDTLVEHDSDIAGADTYWSSARSINFKQQPQTLAVSGLHGCTSVIVISQRGAWMSHLWQEDGFQTEGSELDEDGEPNWVELDDEEFRNVYHSLFVGDVLRPEVLPGLNNYIGPNGALRRGTPGLAVFIVTPRAAPGLTLRPLLFTDKIAYLQRNLRRQFQVDPTVVSYRPITYNHQIYYPDGHINEELRDLILRDSAMGKVVLQYDPMQVRCTKDENGQVDRKQQALWRLWVDQSLQPASQQMWDATAAQLNPNDRCDPNNRQACSAATCGKCDPDAGNTGPQYRPGGIDGDSSGRSLDTADGVEWSGSTDLMAGSLVDSRILSEPAVLDYDNYWAFIREQTENADAIVPHAMTEFWQHGSSSNYVRFNSNDGTSISLKGLWGCVSIVIVSEKGCWIAHIHERYSFERRPDKFQTVLNELFSSVPTGNSPLVGFGRFIQNNEMFDGNLYSVQVFVIHPLSYPGRGVYYENEIHALRWWLNDIFYRKNRGNLCTLLGYVAINEYPSWRSANDEPDGDRMIELMKDLPFGRVLVHYDPRQSQPSATPECANPPPKAMIRMYVDIAEGYRPTAQIEWNLGRDDRVPTDLRRDPFTAPPPLPDFFKMHDSLSNSLPPASSANGSSQMQSKVLARDEFAAVFNDDAAPVCSVQPWSVSNAGPLPVSYYTSFSSYFNMTTMPPEVSSIMATINLSSPGTTFSSTGVSVSQNGTSATSKSYTTTASASLPSSITVTNSTLTSTTTWMSITSGPATSPSATASTAPYTNSTSSRPSRTTTFSAFTATSCEITTNSSPVTTGCSCQSDLFADMVRMIGSDESTTLGCSAGVTFYTPVSTQAPLITEQPILQPPDFCKLHVQQQVRNEGTTHVGWDVSFDFYDPSDNLMGGTSSLWQGDWTQEFSFSGQDWGNDNTIHVYLAVDPATGQHMTQNDINDDQSNIVKGNTWSEWLVEVAAGEMHVLSNETSPEFIMASAPHPYCNTGPWTGNEVGESNQVRDIDCFWNCGKPAASVVESTALMLTFSTITQPLYSTSFATTTDSIPTQTCTVHVDQAVWNGDDVPDGEMGTPFIHRGWNISVWIADARGGFLVSLGYPDEHDWNGDYYVPGEDWNDSNGLIMNFANNPDDNSPVTGGEIDHAGNHLKWTGEPWSSWTVYFRAGLLEWFSSQQNQDHSDSMPFCTVGDWQGDLNPPSKPYRSLQCYWDCGQGVPWPTSTSSTTTIVPTPAPSPECRLNVAQQVLATQPAFHTDGNVTTASELFVNMSLYDTTNVLIYGLAWTGQGFDHRYFIKLQRQNLEISAWGFFGFDRGTAVNIDSYNSEQWASYDTLFGATMSKDGNGEWSMLQYLTCEVGPWSTYEVEQKPARVLECLFDCGGLVMG